MPPDSKRVGVRIWILVTENEHPPRRRGWSVSYTHLDVYKRQLEHHALLLRDADLLVFGRKTYQLMVPYWPDVAKNPSETKADIEFAKMFVSKNKIVFSRSLESAEDKNTKIVRTNLREEMLKLKQEQGKNILAGGVDIPSQLIELGLIDEYRFVVTPIIAGEGRRLLDCLLYTSRCV